MDVHEYCHPKIGKVQYISLADFAAMLGITLDGARKRNARTIAKIQRGNPKKNGRVRKKPEKESNKDKANTGKTTNKRRRGK